MGRSVHRSARPDPVSLGNDNRIPTPIHVPGRTRHEDPCGKRDRCRRQFQRAELSTKNEWAQRLGPDASSHRWNYIRFQFALAGFFFMEAIWAVIGSYVTTVAVRSVAASATLAVGLTFFITVYLLQVHFKRVVVKSASAALNLDALVGVKALPAKSHWSHRTREPARHERPPRFCGSNQRDWVKTAPLNGRGHQASHFNQGSPPPGYSRGDATHGSAVRAATNPGAFGVPQPVVAS